MRLLRSPFFWAVATMFVTFGIAALGLYRHHPGTPIERAIEPALAMAAVVLAFVPLVKILHAKPQDLGILAEDQPAILLGVAVALLYSIAGALRSLLWFYKIAL